MCLLLNSNSVLRQADKDILAYKVVTKDKEGYVSSFRKMPIKFDIPYHSPEFINEFFKVFEQDIKRELGPGGFHSFASMKVAKNFAKRNEDDSVIACIIPKGAMYVKGTWDYASGPYCYFSEAVIYRKLTFWEKLRLRFMGTKEY